MVYWLPYSKLSFGPQTLSGLLVDYLWIAERLLAGYSKLASLLPVFLAYSAIDGLRVINFVPPNLLLAYVLVVSLLRGLPVV